MTMEQQKNNLEVEDDKWRLCDQCKAGNCHFCSMRTSLKVCCCVA